jgi:Mg-chelatase subunit ChlD
VDQSASLTRNQHAPVDDGAITAAIRALAETLDDHDQIAVIRYGETASILVPPGPAGDVRNWSLPPGGPAGDTNLEDAVQLTRAFSDEYETTWILFTDGQGIDALRAPGANPDQIAVVPVGQPEVIDCALSLLPPTRAPEADTSLRPTVRLSGRATGTFVVTASLGNQTVKWTVDKHDHTPVVSEGPEIKVTTEGTLSASIVEAPPGTNAYRENDTSEWIIRLPEQRRRATIVTRDATHPLQQLLPEWSITLTPSLQSAEAGEVLVLDNVPLNLSDTLQRRLIDHTAAGNALLVIGGDRSLGLGNYAGQPLESILPVWASPPEQTSVYCLLDASGSMNQTEAGKSRYQLALDALAMASGSLRTERDNLGLGVFQSDPADVEQRALSPFREDQAAMERARSLAPSGGTVILPGLEVALNSLAESRAGRRELLVLTDAETNPEETADQANVLLDRASEEDVHITWLSVGSNPDPDWTDLLRKHEAVTVIELVAWDSVQQSLNEAFASLKHHVSDPGPHAVSQGAAPDGVGPIPPVMTYLRCSVKENATVHWTVAAQDPLVASIPTGLGRTAVVTTHPDDVWAPEWNASPAVSRLWIALFSMLSDNDSSPLTATRTDADTYTVHWLDPKRSPARIEAVTATGTVPAWPNRKDTWKVECSEEILTWNWVLQSGEEGSSLAGQPKSHRELIWAGTRHSNVATIGDSLGVEWVHDVDRFRQPSPRIGAPLETAPWCVGIALLFFVLDMGLGVLWPETRRKV